MDPGHHLRIAFAIPDNLPSAVVREVIKSNSNDFAFITVKEWQSKIEIISLIERKLLYGGPIKVDDLNSFHNLVAKSCFS